MFHRIAKSSPGPIGVDVGSRAVKLTQFSGDGSRLLEATRVELPVASVGEAVPAGEAVTEAIKSALERRTFRGKSAVLCISGDDLFVQSVRVTPNENRPLRDAVLQEIAGRLPYNISETDVQQYTAADIRKGEQIVQEIVVFACHRPLLDERLAAVERAHLRPVAVDVEPLALLRAYARQFRREGDQQTRTLYAHLGHLRTTVIIGEGEHLLFVKQLEIGGQQLDRSVAQCLGMSVLEAASLRRNNGDRRADRQDPEIARSLAEAVRPMVEQLTAELSLCIRYHSVTFRGTPLERFVLGGGEASPELAAMLSERIHLTGQVSDPFRGLEGAPPIARRGVWDVAAGLALRALPA